MNKIYRMGFLLAAGIVAFSQTLFAIDPFGETGFFLTPHAQVPEKGAINFGYRFLDWPVAGGDLHGGSLIFGVAKDLELGYGVISYGNRDQHTVSAKYRILHNEVTGFSVSVGVQGYLRNTPTGPGEDWNLRGYITSEFPYPYGTFRLGGLVGKDDKDENKPGFMGAVDYMLYPDIIIFYEYTSLSRISGTQAHSGGIRWIPSERLPILVDFGAVFSEFVPGRDNETVFTAGVSFGYHEKYIEERFWPSVGD